MGEEAAGDELRGSASFNVEGYGYGAMAAGGGYRLLEATATVKGRALHVQVTQQRKGFHSRLAFFDVILFVTASEGEELVVNVRHAGRLCDGIWEEMPLTCTVQIARKGAEQAMASERARGQGRGRKMLEPRKSGKRGRRGRAWRLGFGASGHTRVGPDFKCGDITNSKLPLPSPRLCSTFTCTIQQQ